MTLRRLVALLASVALLLPSATVATAAAAPPAPAPSADGRAVADVLATLPGDFRAASLRHDTVLAARLRAEVDAVGGRLRSADLDAAGTRALRALTADVAQTREELQPWPTPQAVSAHAQRLATRAAAVLPAAPTPARPYDEIEAALETARERLGSGDRSGAQLSTLDAWELSVRGFGASAQGTGGTLEAALWEGTPRDRGALALLGSGARTGVVDDALGRASDDVDVLRQSLGDVEISRASVVTDAAVLVFREGLEAVLILAAITASFVGARRALRRPVLLGGIVGLGATAVTWVIAQTIIRSLGDGGLRMEAITGVLAIAVLLVVTNWFFHRVYWSQWIARFNRQRKRLEKLDRLGFISGQTVGLLLLGATSVYREGFETVLFLQNLQVSAGSSATLLGAGIGLGATFAVGVVTFLLQRKLPYKRMLIATGVMIAVVLAVMVGTTAHVLQGLGWLPSHDAPFTAPLWTSRWLGLWATWEGLALQLGAFVFVVGSYWVAREVQVRRPARRRRAAGSSAVGSEVRVPELTGSPSA